MDDTKSSHSNIETAYRNWRDNSAQEEPTLWDAWVASWGAKYGSPLSPREIHLTSLVDSSWGAEGLPLYAVEEESFDPPKRQLVEFDQGWSVEVETYPTGHVVLYWQRRGSLDSHLTDLLPSEVGPLIRALGGQA